MASTDGKSFEDTFKEIVIETGCDCVRFYDTTLGYKNVDNPADFVISFDKTLPSILVELKSCEKTSWKLNFRQLKSLLELKRFTSYVIVWFVEYSRIIALRPEDVKRLLDAGYKSFNPNNDYGIEVIDLCPKFKRVNPETIEYWKLWGYSEYPFIPDLK